MAVNAVPSLSASETKSLFPLSCQRFYDWFGLPGLHGGIHYLVPLSTLFRDSADVVIFLRNQECGSVYVSVMITRRLPSILAWSLIAEPPVMVRMRHYIELHMAAHNQHGRIQSATTQYAEALVSGTPGIGVSSNDDRSACIGNG